MNDVIKAMFVYTLFTFRFIPNEDKFLGMIFYNVINTVIRIFTIIGTIKIFQYFL